MNGFTNDNGCPFILGVECGCTYSEFGSYMCPYLDHKECDAIKGKNVGLYNNERKEERNERP